MRSCLETLQAPPDINRLYRRISGDTGGAAGTGGRHTQYAADTPLANLHLRLLDKMGVPIESLGDATGRLPLEGLSGV